MNESKVRIFPGKSQKYIVAKVGNNPDLMLWGNPNIEWHKDIKTEMEQTGFSLEEVRGGGKLKLIDDPKTIYVWGKSSVFGEALFSEVKKILETTYSDYNIINEIPPGE